MDMSTLLNLKWIANKDLPYSSGNAAQRYAAAWREEECGGEWMHVYAWLKLELSQHC